MTKEQKINLIAAIVLVGFIFSIFFHYFLGFYVRAEYPYNTFLFIPWDRFMDFLNPLEVSRNLNPYYQGGEAVYFPFAFIIFYFFSLIPTGFSLLLFILIFVLGFIYFNYIYLKPDIQNPVSKTETFKNIFIFSFLTYPFLFTIDRANIESFLFIFLALFIFFYLKKDFIKSIIFLSFAISMKLYPVVFLLMFLKDRKFKEIIYAALLTLFLTIISLLCFKGDLVTNIQGMIQGLNYYKQNYITGNMGLAYGASLFGVMKLYLVLLNNIFKIEDLVRIFSFISILSFTIITPYILFIERELWKVTAVIFLTMAIFFHITSDYKLILIFIPLWLFLNTKNSSKNDVLYTIAFGLLLIPKNYFFIVGNVSISIILNPFIMLIMLVVIIIEGIKNKRKLSKVVTQEAN